MIRTIALITVVAATGVLASCASTTSGHGSTQSLPSQSASAGPSGSVSVPSASASVPIPSESTSTSVAVASGSASGTRASKCIGPPSGAVPAPNLAPEGVLTDVLGSGTLAHPVYRYTTGETSGTLKSYCYDGVAEQDVVLMLSFLKGAGYTATPGKIPDQQQIYRSGSTLTPKLIAVTVTGTLRLDTNDFDEDTGSAEVDWQT